MRTQSVALAAIAIVTALSAGAPSSEAATYNLQTYIVCDTGTWCHLPSEQALLDGYYEQVGLMNGQYRTANISYRPLPPVIIHDDRLAGITAGSGTSIGGEPNADLVNELITTYAAPHPERITMFLLPHLVRCWNGIPCPGEDDGFDGDDIVFCHPPLGEIGLTYAHEMGHFWCLRHTFTGWDSTDPYIEDRNGDDDIYPACSTLTNVPDTPDDPHGIESDDFSGYPSTPVEGHEWCETTPFSTNQPWITGCSVECFLRTGGETVTTSFAPLTENAMSYYSPEDCRGPYSVGNVTHEPFTVGQIAQFNECRQVVPVRTQLQEVCGLLGDLDHDGWCNAEDLCPQDADTFVVDTDGDGVPDACDLCPWTFDPSNTDTDNDGAGDVCDPDDDDDGCNDLIDQHPLDSAVEVGTKIYVNCPISTAPWYSSESIDSDADGLIDCMDHDDDNDGIDDEIDPCPVGPCVAPGEACPLNPIWNICLLGGCNEMFLRLQMVSNPDPSTTVYFDDFQILGDLMVVGPLPGRTLAETANALAGQMLLPGGLLPTGDLQLDVMQNVAGVRQAVTTLAIYDPSTAMLGNVVNGRRLAVKLPSDTTPLTIAASWSFGDPPGAMPHDSDSDRVPDFADLCRDVSNPDQQDVDGDGIGDACDADTDQDGLVTAEDVAAVTACEGVDLTVGYVPMDCDAESTDDPPRTPPDLAAAILQQRCRSMDLDGDGQIDAIDTRLAEGRVGTTPGPSGVTVTPDQAFADGFESGTTIRWSDTASAR